MESSTKSKVLIVGLIVILGFVNFNIVRKEMAISKGETIFLKLAPVDPRSIMQGDYMILNYEIVRGLDVFSSSLPAKGYIVVNVDEKRVGAFNRVQSSKRPINEGEKIIKYRLKGYKIYFGGEDFFFEEGTGHLYANAKYGEFRVAESGEVILVGLRDGGLRMIEEKK